VRTRVWMVLSAGSEAREGAGKNEKKKDRKPRPLWSFAKQPHECGVRALDRIEPYGVGYRKFFTWTSDTRPICRRSTAGGRSRKPRTPGRPVAT